MAWFNERVPTNRERRAIGMDSIGGFWYQSRAGGGDWAVRYREEWLSRGRGCRNTERMVDTDRPTRDYASPTKELAKMMAVPGFMERNYPWVATGQIYHAGRYPYPIPGEIITGVKVDGSKINEKDQYRVISIDRTSFDDVRLMVEQISDAKTSHAKSLKYVTISDKLKGANRSATVVGYDPIRLEFDPAEDLEKIDFTQPMYWVGNGENERTFKYARFPELFHHYRTLRQITGAGIPVNVTIVAPAIEFGKQHGIWVCRVENPVNVFDDEYILVDDYGRRVSVNRVCESPNPHIRCAMREVRERYFRYNLAYSITRQQCIPTVEPGAPLITNKTAPGIQANEFADIYWFESYM